MRRLFTTAEALAAGVTVAELRWGERTGRWRRIAHGVYSEGSDPPFPIDRALALVLHTGGVASGHLAGVLHALDSVALRGPVVTRAAPPKCLFAGVRRRVLHPDRIVTVAGVACTNGLQTIIDLAATLDDLRWEQALESILRKRLMVVDDLERELPVLGHSRTAGTKRITRVLELGPPGAPPTESLLETLMVQLA